jgi:hypothetical protein
MNNGFQVKRGDINALSIEEKATLFNKVLPTAERWMKEYPAHSPLYQHAETTLRHWNAIQ